MVENRIGETNGEQVIWHCEQGCCYTVGMAHKCEKCGAVSADVEYTEDPYASDMFDDHEKMWLCGKCLQQRADDI